jgi:ATP-dependent Clp protease adaptor protein ClpS
MIAFWQATVRSLPSVSRKTMATHTKSRPETGAKEKTSLDQPWNVVVHNDPVNLMSYVTMVFCKVFGFAKERAQKHMLEVHHDGRSVVWSGDREQGELYVQQLQGYLLLATLERNS